MLSRALSRSLSVTSIHVPVRRQMMMMMMMMMVCVCVCVGHCVCVFYYRELAPHAEIVTPLPYTRSAYAVAELLRDVP